MRLVPSQQFVMASLALAFTFSAPAFAQTADAGVTADLVIQMQELQDEVRVLRGQVEELQRELESVRQRQRDQYLDLDQRISGMRDGGASAGAVEGVAPESAPAEAAAGAAPIAEPAPVENHPEVRAPLETPSETVALEAPSASIATAAAAPAEEKAAYEKAFQALKELRYADAAQEFQAFVDRYPDSQYAGNAQYWLGESYYVTRNYDIALTAFRKLLDRYPASGKVPDALLKIGYTHYELKQWNEARTALEQVQADFPDTTLARLAENRLRSMKMEGHY